MKMKIICLLLSIVLLLSMAIIPSYAEENDDELISVEISWTAMLFSFDNGSWNEATHTYDGRGWSASENGGEIRVNNNGNASVEASFEFASKQGFENISVLFLKEDQEISTQNIEINESVTVSVCPMGEPSTSFENASMGTIIITITKNGEVMQ